MVLYPVLHWEGNNIHYRVEFIQSVINLQYIPIEYLPSDWTSGTKTFIRGEAGSYILVGKGILKILNLLISYNILKMSHNRSLVPRSHRDELGDEM